jgi:SAM-dependent methyltransferase
MWADLALSKLLYDYEFDTVLDIGSGPGEHARALRQYGKHVLTIDLGHGQADISADFMEHEFYIPFDCIWASHVLEHQRNAGAFLERCYDLLPIGGILAVTVPPAKHEIVGGHVSLWNAGLLLYNLILAGFDCSEAAVRTYGYNISVIVHKTKPIELPRLAMDSGDIHALRRYFPLPVDEGFNGQIISLNWEVEDHADIRQG